jgi:methylmalonyl-CoA mutase N-terminal domain/subunit
VAAVKKFKSERDSGAVQRALEAIRAAAKGDDNLMRRILEAAKARVTLGEIVDALRQVFGEWREPPIYW